MTRRLLLSYLTLALLVLLALEIPLGFVYSRAERGHAARDLEHSAEVLAALAAECVREGEMSDLAPMATQTARKLQGRVVIVDQRGAVLTSSHPLERDETDPAALPEVRTALKGNGQIGQRTTWVGRLEMLSVAVPVEPGPTVRGAVRISISMAPVNAEINQVRWSLALGGLAVLAVSTLVAFALARWITRPVQALERATAHLASGALAARACTTTGPPELRRLASTFNDTAARLQHLINAQRAFAAHASHELKTPLAAMRLRLENLEPDLAPPGTANLEAAITETDRLARMVDGLLTLARLEETPVGREPLDLDAAISERANLWIPLAGEQRVRIAIEGACAGAVWVVPGAVEQIIDNLLANALNAAPAGSTVTLDRRRRSTGPGQHRIELHVIDQGPGMSREHRERAFDRFWRAPGAPRGGTGLGLPVVQQLTRASGGEVDLRPAPAGGVDAVVTLLPVSAPDAPHP